MKKNSSFQPAKTNALKFLAKAQTCLFSRAVGCFSTRWVEFIPSFNPCDHGVSQLDEVFIHLSELRLDLLREFNVAFLHGSAFLWKGSRLEERDQFLLPVDAFVFLLEVHKWVASFAVPDVGEPCLDSISQVIAYNLREQ